MSRLICRLSSFRLLVVLSSAALLALPALASPAREAGLGDEVTHSTNSTVPGSDAQEAKEKRKEKKKDAEGKDGKEGKDAKDDDKKKDKEKPFDEVVKDFTPVKGLFTFYRKDDEGKVYVEILPDQFDKVFLLNPTLESGTGESFLLAAAMLQELPVTFHRVGNTVQLVQKNVMFRADEKKPVSRAVQKGFSDSLLGSTKIEGAPHPDRKSVLVDLSPFLLTDLLGIGPALKASYGTGYAFNKDESSYGTIKSFNENSEIEILSYFRTSDPRLSYTLPDARSLMVHLRYGLSSLKDTGYRPRLGDDRVGHFLTVFQDYSTDVPDEAEVRYINRWQLEKKDPLSTLSEPKQPIVFWIEKTVPEEYREALKDGTLLWNKAFEKIGFKDAIQVKVQPDDADWDAADTRYSTLRWIVAPGASFAQGPSRVNPYTGQIYDADIRFGSDLVRVTLQEFADEVKPLGLGAGPLGLGAGLFGDALGPHALEQMATAGPEALAPNPDIQQFLQHRRPDPSRLCTFADGAIQQAAFGYNLLSARGAFDKNSDEAKKYIRDFLVTIAAHEVGHTLGLRHNFAASSILKLSQIEDAALTTAEGLTGSVMDYTPVNLAPHGSRQGQYWQTSLGPYDYWAIEYAYKPLEGSRPEDEIPALEAIASRAASDHRLAYSTDEDVWGFSSRSIDPRANLWDIGDDGVAYYKGRLANARELWAKMETTFEKPGLSYTKLREVFGRALNEFAFAGITVAKTVGGAYHNRDHVGDPGARLPFQPVSVEKQREALTFLREQVFGPKAMAFPPEMLRKLAPDRMPDIYGSVYSMTRLDYPIHSAVLIVQSAPLGRIYDPLTLQRISDLEAQYRPNENPVSLSEVFTGIRDAIWSELKGGENINSFRRNLQRRHLDILTRLVLYSGSGPEDARTLARADLNDIQSGINAALKSPAGKLDRITKAHLEETRDRITAALGAEMNRSL